MDNPNTLNINSEANSKGSLKIRATTGENLFPVKNARIIISETGAPNSPLLEMFTDEIQLQIW